MVVRRSSTGSRLVGTVFSALVLVLVLVGGSACTGGNEDLPVGGTDPTVDPVAPPEGGTEGGADRDGAESPDVSVGSPVGTLRVDVGPEPSDAASDGTSDGTEGEGGATPPDVSVQP